MNFEMSATEHVMMSSGRQLLGRAANPWDHSDPVYPRKFLFPVLIKCAWYTKITRQVIKVFQEHQ